MAAALAVLAAFTVAAGLTVAALLPGAWRSGRRRRSAGRLAGPGQVLGAAAGAPPASAAATAGGVARALSPVVSSSSFGSSVGVLVTSLPTGQVLYARNASAGFAPASTNKLATAIAALQVLGPSARFRTTVVTGSSPASIVLVGGGDPTLAAGSPPASDYPQPATLKALAAQTAKALRARGHRTVRVGYDTSLYAGPGLAPGWPASYVSTGNTSVITALSADQGRVTASGAAGRQRGVQRPPLSQPRRAGRGLVRPLSRRRRHPGPRHARSGDQAGGATTLATVQSPPLSAIVGLMLEESNNVIAENLARHVAIATGQQASFSGGAAAVTSVLRGLGVSGDLSVVDGSGLSPDDRIAPSVLIQLIRLAASHPRLRPVLTGLPVEGFSGTLSRGGSVFGLGGKAGFGVVRAKTGNLNTVAALAGTAYARNGELLAFAVMADRIPAAGLAAAATTMVDLAATLAGCGCR